uniref:Uncharacterized protein n=1 Tax=Glossina austeni TaxID=7395 RepID=A0A1A9VR94_GLOAU
MERITEKYDCIGSELNASIHTSASHIALCTHLLTHEHDMCVSVHIYEEGQLSVVNFLQAGYPIVLKKFMLPNECFASKKRRTELSALYEWVKYWRESKQRKASNCRNGAMESTQIGTNCLFKIFSMQLCMVELRPTNKQIAIKSI